jgi:hypothetical protein
MNSEQAGTDPSAPLVEEAAQPENNAGAEQASALEQDGGQKASILPEEEAVIWTPRFIVLFAAVLALGVSLESLLTQGWSIRWFSGTWVFLVHLALVAAGWIILLRGSRSRWMRFGAAFGLVFVAFVAINVILQEILFQPSSYLLAHVNVVTFLALAGCYLCLSIDSLPIGRWDSWLLGLLPVLGVVLLVPIFIVRSDRSLAGWENSISLVALILSVLMWWGRPACWKNMPGQTLLFGAVPLLFLLLDLVYVSSGSFNFFPVHVAQNAPATYTTRQTVFFFSQVVLLCLLLGQMRLAKSENRLLPEPRGLL